MRLKKVLSQYEAYNQPCFYVPTQTLPGALASGAAQTWSARKRNQRTRHVNISTIQYSHTWTSHLLVVVYLRD